jgi:poly(beta-D-mannuronate) lyase
MINHKKKRHHTRYFILAAFTLVSLISFNPAPDIKVKDMKELNEAVAAVKPGGKIMLANGIWKDVEILLNAKGTEKAPIEITAEEKGKVFIEGLSNLRISGEYLVVSGLVFRNGYTPTGDVIAFREKDGVYGNNCRLTECVIDNFNNPERFETELWVSLYGKNNRVDHCYFVDKRSQGVTLAVRLEDKAGQENNHRIDHNYFGFRQKLASNGGETMRLGTSPNSLSTSGTLVEANYFEHCDGEQEIISNKSCGNTFRNNTFWECSGTLSYRHGHDNLAEGNFFFGNGKDNTGGIRIINERNKAINNYFYKLTGYRFRGALVVMNGVPNSPINRYNQVVGGVFSNNTFIDCDYIQLCAGSDAERSAVPVDTKIENNVFYHSTANQIFTAYDDISGITFTNNFLNLGVKPIVENGIELVEMKLTTNLNGLAIIESPRIHNAGCNMLKPLATAENTGVKWYPRKSVELQFGTGKDVVVEPGENTLAEAVSQGKAGDVFLLKTGNYLNSKNIFIRNAVTIKAVPGAKPVLLSEKNSMFSIENEGALKLSGLEISGRKSPDMAGNSIVTTSKYSMNRNYKLIVENCIVKDLDINYAFDFLKIYKNTMADSIVIRNCRFTNITGHVLELNKEYEDLGIYNAEYVILENSDFSDVQNSVLTVYRGGTDESTFGPFVKISDCSMIKCGKGKRNKDQNAIYLHGVQLAKINNLNLVESADFRLFLTNGDPVTKIDKLNIYPESDIVSNNKKYELTNLTHQSRNKQ